jgi:hypothetical protein
VLRDGQLIFRGQLTVSSMPFMLKKIDFKKKVVSETTFLLKSNSLFKRRG